MAERKKSSDKIKSSVKLTTAKPEPKAIDSALVETTEEDTVTSKSAAAKSQNRASIATHRRWSSILTSQSVTLVIAVTGVVVALVALSVSAVVYWQTADLVSSGRLQPNTVTNGIDTEDLAQFRRQLDNLAGLIKQNANDYEALQQQFANTTAAKDADMSVSSSMAVKSGTDVPDKASLDDVIARLAVLEAVSAKQNLVPVIPDLSAEQDGFDDAQIGLLAAAGLLAENLAGRDLDIWIGVFNELQWPGIDPTDRETISMAAQVPVVSRADLLSLGRLQLASMVQSLNKAEDGSGLLERTWARLAKFIQLRRTGGVKDRPETVLASFETALENADFDAAFAAATLWSSSGFGGLESWLAAAQRRHNLDLAVNQLVATFVQYAVGKS